MGFLHFFKHKGTITHARNLCKHFKNSFNTPFLLDFVYIVQHRPWHHPRKDKCLSRM